MLIIKNISGDDNEKVFTVSRKLVRILTISSKSHHLIEILISFVLWKLTILNFFPCMTSLFKIDSWYFKPLMKKISWKI